MGKTTDDIKEMAQLGAEKEKADALVGAAGSACDSPQTTSEQEKESAFNSPAPARTEIGTHWHSGEERLSEDEYLTAGLYPPSADNEQHPLMYNRGEQQDKKNFVSEKVQSVKEKAGGVADRVQKRTGEYLNQAQEKSKHLSDDLGTTSNRLWNKTRNRTAAVRHRVANQAYEYPVLMAAGALALGFLVGSLFPSTRKESQIMGEKRDEFIEEAKAGGRDMINRAKHVARDSVRSAADTAKVETSSRHLSESSNENQIPQTP